MAVEYTCNEIIYCRLIFYVGLGYHFLRPYFHFKVLVKNFLILSLSTYDMAYMHVLNTFTGSASRVSSCPDIYQSMY